MTISKVDLMTVYCQYPQRAIGIVLEMSIMPFVRTRSSMWTPITRPVRGSETFASSFSKGTHR